MKNGKINRPCTMGNMERKAEIRAADDGFSLFTWSDFGGTIGVVLWREAHGLEWREAYISAVEWVNGAVSGQNGIAAGRA